MSGPPSDPRLPTHSTPDPRSSSSSSSLSKQIDPFTVYEQAVQTPAIECANLSSLYYNAQPIGSRRPEARVLREDFSSTGAVAVRWVNMAEGNRAQAVDLDLEALKIARRRLLAQQRGRAPGGEEWRARLVQHAELNVEGEGSRWLDASEDEGGVGKGAPPLAERPTTWAEGATTDRFERKYQARQARERKGKDKKKLQQQQGQGRRRGGDQVRDRDDDGERDLSNGLDSISFTGGNAHVDRQEVEAPHLLCIHSSVLSLPVPLPPPVGKGNREGSDSICPPDVVASLNYALSYFHRRSDLLTYLVGVRKSLRAGTGVLICDQFAGPLGEAAQERAGRGARQLSAEEEHEEQEQLWRRFAKEEGFLRRGETIFESLPTPLDAKVAGIQCWKAHVSAQGSHAGAHSQDGAASSQWPRGRLSLVRKGTVPHPTIKGKDVAFEYWREDAPVDLVTNRFRMSLSFRFSEDGSWTRDFFSYDFRFWTLAEVLEALEEAGFVDVSTQVLDRGLAEDDEDDENGDASSVDSGEDPDADLAFLARTEKEESREDKSGTTEYRKIRDGEKVFARRSFATYVVARAPSAEEMAAGQSRNP